MYVTVSIGNTDNKLSQQEWSEFVNRTHKLVSEYADQVHFDGGSSSWLPWQNMCWLIEIDEGSRTHLYAQLLDLKQVYRQDSIFVLEGKGLFL